MSKYTTGEIAKLCNISVRTVQYYDVREVLIPSEFSDGGRRLYSDDDLQKLKVICFLKDLGFSLDNITRLLSEENSPKIVNLLIEEQLQLQQDEINKGKERYAKLSKLKQELKGNEFSVESIADIAHGMTSSKQLRKVHLTMLLTGIPVSVFQWVSIILWITQGYWWLFAAWAVVAIPFAIFISAYYFNSVEYVCPDCHTQFKPSLKEAFWAPHTPKTRKLKCPHCNKKSYCIEVYKKTKPE